MGKLDAKVALITGGNGAPAVAGLGLSPFANCQTSTSNSHSDNSSTKTAVSTYTHSGHQFLRGPSVAQRKKRRSKLNRTPRGSGYITRRKSDNGAMKLRYAAALVLCVELSGCGSRLSLEWSPLDWFGLGLIFLVIVLVGIGFVGLARTIRK
jgi:hypothetical protein